MSDAHSQHAGVDVAVAAFRRLRQAAFRDGATPIPLRALRARRRPGQSQPEFQVPANVHQAGLAFGDTPADRYVRAHVPGAADLQDSPGLGASSARWHRRDPHRIGGPLGRLTTSGVWGAALAGALVAQRWPRIVGEAVAQHTGIESFTDGTLVVRASSTAWATQLRLELPRMLRRVRDEAGDAIQKIVILGPDRPSWKHGRFSVRGRGPRDTYG